MQNRTDSRIPCFSTPYPNMDVALDNIVIKVLKYIKYEIKVKNFFRFLVVSNILSFSSIICVKRN